MTKISDFAHGSKVRKISKLKNVTIIDTDSGNFVIKKSHIDENILMYLKSRNFDYIPDIVENDEYVVTRFIDGINLSENQKVEDLIKLVSLLHSKTTYYSNVNVEKNEKIYKQLNDNINYLYSFYTDQIVLSESKVFMSPSELLFASNITKLYDLLDFSKRKLEKWHEIVSEKKRERNVVIHNNLGFDHFIRNSKPYLISWDKSKIDSPVFDLFKLYKNESDFDFNFFLNLYEKSYPLLEDEKLLLELLITIPDDISFLGSDYKRCQNINRIIEKCEFLPEASKQGEKKENK